MAASGLRLYSGLQLVVLLECNCACKAFLMMVPGLHHSGQYTIGVEPTTECYRLTIDS